ADSQRKMTPQPFMAATEVEIARDLGEVQRHLAHFLGPIDNDEGGARAFAKGVNEVGDWQTNPIVADPRKKHAVALRGRKLIDHQVHHLGRRDVPAEDSGPNAKAFDAAIRLRRLTIQYFLVTGPRQIRGQDAIPATE